MPGSARSPATAIARSEPPKAVAVGAQRVLVAAGQHQPGALGDQLLGAGASEPARRARDDVDAIAEP